MNTNLRIALPEICTLLQNELELKFNAAPFGSCYLLGHCLAEGLSKSGFSAREVSGHLILQDKNDKPVVYGTAKYKGRLVGYYHTWCVLNDGENIIVDPSMKYNKVFLKQEYKIKVNQKISDIIIVKETTLFPVQYIEDTRLVQQSKEFLNTVNKNVINELINKISAKVDSLVGKQRD
jgi:hypothetical protein